MYALARRSLLWTPKSLPRRSHRITARRRVPCHSRRFHISAIVRKDLNDSADSNGAASTPSGTEGSGEPSADHVSISDIVDQEDASSEAQRANERNGDYGSAARRAMRNKKPRDPRPVVIPTWFTKHNVLLREEAGQLGIALDIIDDHVSKPADSVAEISDGVENSPTGASEASQASEESRTEKRYQLHQQIWNEILAHIRAGLSLPGEIYANGFAARKAHVLLQCPKDGGIYFLDSVVSKAAELVGADLIRLDAQDLAEIGGDYLGEGLEPSPYSMRSLAYEAQQVVARRNSREMEDAAEEEDEAEEDEEAPSSTPRGLSSRFNISLGPRSSRPNPFPIANLSRGLEELFKSGKIITGFISPNKPQPFTAPQVTSQPLTSLSRGWEELKLSALSAAILASAQTKDLSERSKPADSEDQENSAASENSSVDTSNAEAPNLSRSEPIRPIIVLIRDYKELQSTSHGDNLLGRIHDQVLNRRKAGQKIMLIGTVSSADLMPSISRSAFRNVQSEYEDGPGRTIIVTPPRTPSLESIFEADERRRMREINMRHLQDMIRQRSPDPKKTSAILAESDLRVDSSLEYSSGLEESVWPFDRVHRVAVTALGLMGPDEELGPEMIAKALRLLDSSDEVKFQWAVEETEQRHLSKDSSNTVVKGASGFGPGPTSEEKMKRVRKECNDYERRLLGGVVIPENIHTTFADVHAPSETVEALKTLTSLSLIRPEAFSYGVLATNKIPGLLLYGPPGTGKTLLAKAVAKESGATVLEVSGSEVYDMYVGEGEKNVKAIFTLAKKLSPCVVFIDEADAIFGSRGGHSGNRTTHRELINQFLREWDGMNEMSAFIMVATNRPFDLDDAVLRRLPRRLLVDLPVESDREAILRVHLKDEKLDPSVSLSELAARTPFYSGSDLKNLSVAAALACVREETEQARKYPADQGEYKYPERRTLEKRHFETAMAEISASISEDMSSLAAIRKFDERYGDRKGRKKKGGWGFGNVADANQQLETGRVRK